MPFQLNPIKIRLNKWLLQTGWTAPANTIEEAETAKLLSGITLFSTTTFVVLALMFRFLLNLCTSSLLRLYSIHFKYRLFDYGFSSVDSSKWPPDRILFVFGFGFLIFTLIGAVLVIVYRNIHNVSWKTRLILTWMAFILANSIPAGIIAGILFCNNFYFVF